MGDLVFENWLLRRFWPARQGCSSKEEEIVGFWRMLVRLGRGLCLIMDIKKPGEIIKGLNQNFIEDITQGKFIVEGKELSLLYKSNFCNNMSLRYEMCKSSL